MGSTGKEADGGKKVGRVFVVSDGKGAEWKRVSFFCNSSCFLMFCCFRRFSATNNAQKVFEQFCLNFMFSA